MATKSRAKKILDSNRIKGWHLDADNHDHYVIGLEPASRHRGKNCAYIESIVEDTKNKKALDLMGHLTQVCGVEEFNGKRVRMTAWAKSELPNSSLARLEVCAIGTWGAWCKWNGTFDNMGDRPLVGSTDWAQYSFVIDVPETATSLSFGVLLIGIGKVWIDEFSFEVVDKDTPLTGIPSKPINLNFED